MRFAWLVGLMAVMAALVPAAPSRAQGEKAYRVGDKVAGIALPTIEGKTVKLSQFKGKVVVVNILAHW